MEEYGTVYGTHFLNGLAKKDVGETVANRRGNKNKFIDIREEEEERG
jgi:hypothetical protein